MDRWRWVLEGIEPDLRNKRPVSISYKGQLDGAKQQVESALTVRSTMLDSSVSDSGFE